MKFKKIGLCLIFFIISLFIIKTNIYAYDIFESTHSGGTYTEFEIYQEFLKIEGFNINKYKNIYCSGYDNRPSYMYCYALTDETVNSLYIPAGSSFTIKMNNYDGCDYYSLYLYRYDISKHSSEYRTCAYNGSSLSYYTPITLSNFNFPFLTEEENKTYNLLDFSPYISGAEEIPEPEINIKATNLLNIMLAKTNNIYEVLIENEIFKFFIGILISYLIFIFLFRFIKKE